MAKGVDQALVATLKETANLDLNRIELFLKDRISAPLLEHSQRTADTALELAQYHDLDHARAYAAAMLHDVAKSLETNEKRALLRRSLTILPGTLHPDLEDFTSEEHIPEAVLHSWVGAIFVAEELDVQDPLILSAIAKHTTGAVNMSPLDKVVFLADIIEPHRHLPHLDQLRTLARESLESAYYYAISSQLKHLVKRNLPVHHVIYKIIEIGREQGWITDEQR